LTRQPLVTIQIPTYNQKAFIIEALESALAQTYDNLQIIVVDDCSPDYDIYEHLKDYQDNPKVEIKRNEKNLGRVANYRYILYHHVQGEWFMNLDGDDYLINNEFIANAIENIEKAGAYDIVMYKGNTVMETVNNSGIQHIDIGNNILLVTNTDFLSHLKYDFGFSHSAQLYYTVKAKEANFYNRNLLDADYFSYLKIMQSGYIIMSAEPVYHWREHQAQETHSVTTSHVLARFDAVDELRQVYTSLGKVGVEAVAYTRLVVYYYLLIVASSQRVLWKDMGKILAKTKWEKAYIVSLLSTIKRYYIKRKE